LREPPSPHGAAGVASWQAGPFKFGAIVKLFFSPVNDSLTKEKFHEEGELIGGFVDLVSAGALGMHQTDPRLIWLRKT
jgi:hypothetical protein